MEMLPDGSSYSNEREFLELLVGVLDVVGEESKHQVSVCYDVNRITYSEIVEALYSENFEVQKSVWQNFKIYWFKHSDEKIKKMLGSLKKC